MGFVELSLPIFFSVIRASIGSVFLFASSACLRNAAHRRATLFAEYKSRKDERTVQVRNGHSYSLFQYLLNFVEFLSVDYRRNCRFVSDFIEIFN